MLGILVIVLRSDRITALGFSLGQGQIPLIVSLRTVRVFRLGAGGIQWPRFERSAYGAGGLE